MTFGARTRRRLVQQGWPKAGLQFAANEFWRHAAASSWKAVLCPICLTPGHCGSLQPTSFGDMLPLPHGRLPICLTPGHCGSLQPTSFGDMLPLLNGRLQCAPSVWHLATVEVCSEWVLAKCCRFLMEGCNAPHPFDTWPPWKFAEIGWYAWDLGTCTLSDARWCDWLQLFFSHVVQIHDFLCAHATKFKAWSVRT